MTPYAKGTKVPISRTRNEIEAMLAKHGADAFGYATKGNRAAITFEMSARRISMEIPLPEPEDFRYMRNGHERSEREMRTAWDQACRERWRSILLAIKAKLDAVASGITTIDNEFMAHIMLPEGVTVGEWLQPQIDESYRTKAMPLLLSTRPIALPPGRS